jgi:hypothetical protein
VASAGERPDLDALRELEDVLRLLAEELSGWRRRALTAEARVAEVTRLADGDGGGTARVEEMEDANRGLERRLVTARAQVQEILGRLRFLEQQGGGAGGERA